MWSLVTVPDVHDHLYVHSFKQLRYMWKLLDYKAVFGPENLSTLQGQQNFLPLSVIDSRFLGHPTLRSLY